MKKVVMLIAVVLIMVSATAKADDYADALRVYKEYLAGTIKKDLGLVMDRLDKSSPTYNNEIKSVAEAMINTNMNFKIISADLIGVKGDIIVIRVVQKNLPQSDDSDLNAVEVDALLILKKDESGKWKFRNSEILSAKKVAN